MTDDVDRVRAFHRRWSSLLSHLGTDPDDALSRTEAQVVDELHRRGRCRRSELRARLGIDASFLSRVVRRLADRGLVETTASADDGRAVELALTPAGVDCATELAERTRARIAAVLAPLTGEQRTAAVEAMGILTHLVRVPGERSDGRDLDERDVVVRSLRPGDLGWIAGRNGAVYADEFGWGEGYEALCAEIVAEFDRHLDPAVERGFIVEVDGARAGCALLRRRTAAEAQIRLVLVERWARGLGLGARLVDECLCFARDAGYASIMLWTNDVLTAARRIYEAAGFELVEEDPHHSFGHDLIGQVWSRRL